MSRVDTTCPSGCWEWQGHINKTGYGLSYENRSGKNVTTIAHRLAWKFHYGPIPDGKFVLHKCDNRKCVNPNHLFIGDAAINAQDMVQKGRKHLIIGENNHSTKLKKEQALTVRALLLEGKYTQQEIAAMFGISRGSVEDIKRGRSWRHLGTDSEMRAIRNRKTNINRAPKGEAHGQSKLSRNIVLEIRELLQSGEHSQREIARRFGVRQGTISRIKRGASWSHI